jgi:hypothetical protein
LLEREFLQVIHKWRGPRRRPDLDPRPSAADCALHTPEIDPLPPSRHCSYCHPVTPLLLPSSLHTSLCRANARARSRLPPPIPA